MVRKISSFQEAVERKTCQWMGSDTKKHEFCGERKVRGRPYCEKHCRVAYVNYKPEEASNG